MKNVPNTGKFVLYHLGQENNEYVLASAVFDVNGPNVKVSCYINEELLKELTLKREAARIMWTSLVEDGYSSQNALPN